MISTADLHWVAGFLEGEGSFTCITNIQVKAAQVKPWPLLKLQRLFGGSVIPNSERLRANEQLCFQWQLSGLNSAALMMTLYGLMSPKRRRQIVKALSKWRGMQIAAKDRTQCVHGHPFTPSNTYRWRIRGKGMKRACRICQLAKQHRRREGLRSIA